MRRPASDRLNAFVLVDDAARGRGRRLAVKDNIDVRGMPTRAGGRHLPGTPAPRDAECVRRLRAAGYVIVGKTNLYEYAMGASSHNEHYGDVRNPRDVKRDAGGSSSGSAAAVAAGLADVALGTDTLGSVRIPAAFCGIVGYKPPRAAIPRRGVFPNSETLDAVGVLARDVRAAARLVDVMRGARVPRRRVIRPRLAVPWAWLEIVSDEVHAAFLRVARGLPDLPLPALDVYGPAAFGVLQYESQRLHRGWLRDAPERYGAEVRELLAQSERATPSSYATGRRELARVRRLTRAALATVDAVILPTAPFRPPPLGGYPLELRRVQSVLTRPWNVADSAVFSIPLPVRGLPIGLQIAANDETTAIAVASHLERRLRTSA